MLKKWRLSRGFTYAQAAAFFGLKSPSQLFAVENGDSFPQPETIAQIEGATNGVITAADHMRAWQKKHPLGYSQFRAAGRSAAKAYYRPPAKPKSRGS